MRFLALILSLVLLSAQAGEFDFKNLGFDEANTGALRPGRAEFGPAAELLPGWTVEFGATTPSLIGYDAAPGTSLFSNYASVWGNDFAPSAVQGRFAFYMVSLNGALGTPSVRQFGEIPSGMAYLAFTYFGYYPDVTWNGQRLRHVAPEPFYSFEDSPTDIYLDVSQFSGKLGELRFAIPSRGSGGGELFLDNIHFTNIPEPAIGSLLVMDAVILGFHRWPGRSAWSWTTGYRKAHVSSGATARLGR